MRRALSALAVTVIGVVWIVTFRVTPVPVDASSQLSPSQPTARTTAPRQPVPTQPAGTTTSGQGGDGSYTGSKIRTVYGDVQVKVTVSGNKITDVQPLVLPSDRARSAYISQVAGPMLRTEAITAQSSSIDIISGATYTSIAYKRSLDSALKQAHLG
ncbi:MAG TPA: FMN-binding protein [Candidatus Limnocylindria bacterium]